MARPKTDDGRAAKPRGQPSHNQGSADNTPAERVVLCALDDGHRSQILKILESAALSHHSIDDLSNVVQALDEGAALLIVPARHLVNGDSQPLRRWLEHQAEWSDLPILILHTADQLPDQSPPAHFHELGNIQFLSHPVHPQTLQMQVVSALRGRRRQYRERSLLQEWNAELEQRLHAQSQRQEQREEANRQAQKMEAVGRLTGGIAHDFNNMLTGVIGSLELMRRRLAKGRTHELESLIDLSIASANRAAGLTHRLLAFSRRQSLDSRPVRLDKLVDAAQGLLKRSLESNIALDLQLQDGGWTAQADPSQLESALLNLVVNARDAMPMGGKLVVRTHRVTLPPTTPSPMKPGDYVMLSVHDDGCGMPESVIARAFDPFFTTKPIGQGTGLGLSMVYGFAQQSNGHVEILSETGKGTTVNLYLPRFQGTDTLELPKTRCESDRAQAGESVLVVEDDAAVRKLVCAVLADLGYAYYEAVDANSAEPVLNSTRRIDLMISDVGLPGMNGRQLAEVGRHYRPGLKVLFITGYAENATIRGGFLDPGMELITKPFAFEVLTAKVREMIGAVS